MMISTLLQLLATTSDAADKEASNKNDENDDTTATTSNADVLNDDNKASDSDAKKLPLNLQPMIASDSESTLFGVTAYTLPNTWYNVTSAGAAKANVQSITISKYPTPAPTTYTHNYTIPGSDGLEVYANVEFTLLHGKMSLSDCIGKDLSPPPHYGYFVSKKTQT